MSLNVIYPPKPPDTTLFRTTESSFYHHFARQFFDQIRLFLSMSSSWRLSRVIKDMRFQIAFVSVDFVTVLDWTGMGLEAEMSGSVMYFQGISLLERYHEL